ncbi:MAG: anhydro-N-acetylmuramic acid kinase [Oscillospiraceae bacterium]|nr:anhydro-N-acetylmuramic acid kinase [Oscillospiraceae bacterium]
MMLAELMKKRSKLVIGLMGGTSADGVDAVLVRIDGWGEETRMEQLAYVSIPFESEVRRRILDIARGDFGGSRELGRMNMLLGELYLDACLRLCRRAGVEPGQIDLIGSHGQTVYHQPVKEPYLGREISATYQIGDVSILCEKIGAPVVSDFRVRDMAAGGQGAPLVPYTEYLLYRKEGSDIALQNIGGMGNITFLPRGGALDELIAFDTGPGNVLIDAVVERLSKGKLRYDEGGVLAAACPVSEELLDRLLEDPYLRQMPPKTTGREKYDQAFLQEMYRTADALSLSDGEVLSTATCYTARTIALAVRRHLPRLPELLIVGGGGSYNLTLLNFLRESLPEVKVVTNEDLGRDGDAKEAAAFALLANEAIHGVCSNAPAATGASHPVVMGKISQ